MTLLGEGDFNAEGKKKSFFKKCIYAVCRGFSFGSWYQEFPTIISYCCSEQFMFITVKAAISPHLKNLKTEFSTA